MQNTLRYHLEKLYLLTAVPCIGKQDRLVCFHQMQNQNEIFGCLNILLDQLYILEDGLVNDLCLELLLHQYLFLKVLKKKKKIF